MAPSQPEVPSAFEPSKWFQQSELKSVPEPARTLFAEYSKIPDEKIVEHVHEVLDLPQSPSYPEILDTVKSGGKLLDLGCALGQEIRQLVYDGAPSENIYGSDINTGLANVGYDLFLDRDTLKSEFIVSDILDDKSDLVNRLTGQLDIVNAMSFFHLFDWDQQVVIAKRIVSLLRPRPGSLVVGRHVGSVRPSQSNDKGMGMLGYCHNEESWKQLWEVVGKETGTKWKVDVVTEVWALSPAPEILEMVREQGIIKLRFEIRRQ